jgi:hypothetical protein
LLGESPSHSRNGAAVDQACHTCPDARTAQRQNSAASSIIIDHWTIR